MSERRLSTMPPHGLMPHSIPPRTGRAERHWFVTPRQIERKPANDPYGAGFNGDVSGYAVKNPSRANHRPKWPDGFIGPVEVIPGKPLFVIAQLTGAIVSGPFQPARMPQGTLVFTAEARIGLNQAGFVAVAADCRKLKMRVGDAGGPLQELSAAMPPYDPAKLVVEYRNGFVIASA